MLYRNSVSVLKYFHPKGYRDPYVNNELYLSNYPNGRTARAYAWLARDVQTFIQQMFARPQGLAQFEKM